MTNLTDGPLVLGIETSCDETGAGIVRGRELLADEVASSMDQHARFGGVVPEVASRAHLEAMVPVIEGAFAKAGVRPADIDAVAVTAGPGLAGALMVGVAAAKAYAYALGKPLYGVNHLAAHVAVDQLEHGPLPAPCLALLVSGGHSSLLLVPDITGEVRSLGATIDDAAGEAYDKVARVLGMPFPGGPPIDRAAASGNPAAIRFPRAKLHDGSYDFSFAGLKTAVARWVEARRDAGEPVPVADVAASFQEAVADVLTRKAVAACREHGVTDLVIGGGVAANSRLRALAAERARPRASGSASPARACAPTTARWWRPSARRWSRPAAPPSTLALPGRLVSAGDRDPGPVASLGLPAAQAADDDGDGGADGRDRDEALQDRDDDELEGVQRLFLLRAAGAAGVDRPTPAAGPGPAGGVGRRQPPASAASVAPASASARCRRRSVPPGWWRTAR